MSRTTFLAARGPDADLGLRTALVRRVIPATEWNGPPAVDLSLLSFGVPEEQTAVHVIIVDTITGERALATSKPLVVRDCEPNDVVGLPPELWPTGAVPPFAGLVQQPSLPPLLILGDHALAHDRRLPVASGEPAS